MELVLIGASNNLKNINYSVFKKLNIKVKYLVSNSLTERTKIFAKKFQTTILNYNDLKKKNDFDIAYISTLESNRYEIAKYLILNGKDIIFEKNFLLNEVKEKELIELSKQNKTNIFQSLIAKYHNQYQKVIKKNKNKLGKISHINLIFTSPFKDLKNYRHSDKINGGIINDYLYYILEIFKNVTDEKILSFEVVKEKYNEHDIETTVKFFFEFSNLITSNVIISYDFFKQNISEIICEKGLIRFYNPITFDEKTRIDLFLPKNKFQRGILHLKNMFIPNYKHYYSKHQIQSKIIKFNDPIYDLFKYIINKKNISNLEFNNLNLFHEIKNFKN